MFAKTAQYERMVTENITNIETITGKNTNIGQFKSFLDFSNSQTDPHVIDVSDVACHQRPARAAIDRVCELCGRYR